MSWHHQNYQDWPDDAITSILFDGVEVRDWVLYDTLQLNRSLNTSESSMDAISPHPKRGNIPITPIPGMEVIVILDDGTGEEGEGLRVGGYIATLDEESEDTGGNNYQLHYSITLTDYSVLATRSLFSGTWTNKKAEEIVEEVVANGNLSKDGVVDVIYSVTPDVLPQYNASLRQPHEIFDDLCNITGWQWFIMPQQSGDPSEKVLVFRGRDDDPAAIGINESGNKESLSFSNLKISRSDDQYRNAQVIRAGNKETAIRREKFNVLSITNNYTLSFPVSVMIEARYGPIGSSWASKTPLVTKEKETAVDGDGTNLVFAPGDQVVEDISATSPMTPGVDELEIEYRGRFPLIVMRRDEGAIATRAGIDNTTGEIWGFEDHSDIDDQDMMIKTANALLERFAEPTLRVSVDVASVPGDDWAKLRPGNIIDVNLPWHNINNHEMLIEKVDIRVTDDEEPRRMTITAIDWLGHGDWLDFFRNLYRQLHGDSSRDNEQILQFMPFPDETIGVSDDFNAAVATAGPALVDIALVDRSEVS